MMRKVRDYDAELKALGDKARTLKARKIQQLGELVASTGADALDPEVLAGALLHIVAHAQVEGNREALRSDGAVVAVWAQRLNDSSKTNNVPA